MCPFHSYNRPAPIESHRMPWDLMARTLRELASLGTKSIDICGLGEPLLHPNAADAFRLIKELGMECRLVTNGSFLTRELCDEFLRIGLDRLRVSLNSATDETHHTITLAPPGERSEIMANVRYLIARRNESASEVPVVGTTIAIHKLNYAEVAKLGAEAAEVGIDHLEFLPLAIHPASAELVLGVEERAEARRQVQQADAAMCAAGKETTARDYLSLEDSEDWTREWFHTMPCYIGQFFSRVTANGDVNPCCPCWRLMGNLAEQSFGDIWMSEGYRSFRLQGMDLPNRREPLEECACSTCYHFAQIALYHGNLMAGHLDGLP
jgi:MoaA/NifB/PqqE/SkfB family radical SAM enzyme